MQHAGTPVTVGWKGSHMEFAVLGDAAVLVHPGERIDPETHRRGRAFCARVAGQPFAGFIECVPTFTSLAVVYDPVRVSQAAHTFLAANIADFPRTHGPRNHATALAHWSWVHSCLLPRRKQRRR